MTAAAAADPEEVAEAAQTAQPAKAACVCRIRSGLQRLHSVTGPHGLAQRAIEGFCVACGAVPTTPGAALHPDDLVRSDALYRRVDKAHAAVKASVGTTAELSDMPLPLDFEDLGLIYRLPPAALFEPFPTDRPSLEPHLRSMLGLSDEVRERVLEAPGFQDVTVTLALTVQHVFDLDADGKDRANPNHVSFWPMLASTVNHPFEVWKQQPEGAKSAGWAFFAAYRIGNAFAYHMAFINRRRQVLTSYRLTGIDQLAIKRTGVPVYLAYR